MLAVSIHKKGAPRSEFVAAGSYDGIDNSVAASSFIYTGGDTYHAFGNSSDAEKPIPFGFDYEALTSYLVEGCNHVIPDAYAQPQGRITITGLQ